MKSNYIKITEIVPLFNINLNEISNNPHLQKGEDYLLLILARKYIILIFYRFFLFIIRLIIIPKPMIIDKTIKILFFCLRSPFLSSISLVKSCSCSSKHFLSFLISCNSSSNTSLSSERDSRVQVASPFFLGGLLPCYRNYLSSLLSLQSRQYIYLLNFLFKL